MTEHRTIKVAVYRDNDGHPVCAKHFPSGQVCEFLRTERFGTVDFCALDGSSLDRSDNSTGLLTPPAGGCKVWSNDETT